MDITEDLWRKIPGGSLKGGSELLEGLWHYFYMKEIGGRLYLFLGDRPLLCADSRDVLDAFLLGAAWAYRSLPEPILEKYRAHLLKTFTPPTKRPVIPGMTPL